LPNGRNADVRPTVLDGFVEVVKSAVELRRDTHPVWRFSIRYRLRACEGLGPKYIPSLARGDQWGIVFPEDSLFWRANTGHPKVCMCPNFMPTLIELNISSLEVPSSKTGKVLWRYIAYLKAYGQRAKWMAAGQR
jgi:hypothetical protein